MLGAITILAVAGSLYQNIAAEKIGQILPDATREDILQLTSGRYSTIFQSLDLGIRDQVVREVTLAICNGFIILVAGSALAFVSSFFLSVSIKNFIIHSCPHIRLLIYIPSAGSFILEGRQVARQRGSPAGDSWHGTDGSKSMVVRRD